MNRCTECSYTPRTRPVKFCPACGAVWSQPKPKPKPKVEITEVAVKKNITKKKVKK